MGRNFIFFAFMSPNTPHWHGASADTAFVQVAITSRESEPTIWLAGVTDEEYHSSHQD